MYQHSKHVKVALELIARVCNMQRNGRIVLKKQVQYRVRFNIWHFNLRQEKSLDSTVLLNHTRY